MWSFIKNRLSPFSVKSFRLFFFAQSISLVGTWSHELARSWLVLDMAGTTTALGTLLLCTALPGLFLTLHGGTIADRADVRKIIILTKSILAVSALALFFIVLNGHLKLWMIFAFALIEGFVNSFDGPAFTTVFSRTLPREHFQQALAIQSTSFHVSRMLGPAVAGAIMAFKGPAYVFLFDAISYIGVILIVRIVDLRVIAKPQTPQGDTAISRIKHGLKYFFGDKLSRYKLIQYYFSIALIFPLVNLVFRNYLKQKFDLNSEQFGYLFSFPAMGAMSAAIYFTFGKLQKPIKNLIVGVPAVVISILFLEHATTPFSSALILGVSGFFNYLNIASLTQSLQIHTADEYRGRLGSILTLGFSSISPLMGFPVGIFTDSIGFEPSIRYLTLSFGILSAILAYTNFRQKPSDVI
jgi:MFS family permease